MAIESPSPSISTHQSTGTGNVGLTNENQQNVRDDLVNEGSMASDFVNSEPIREEQVQNAVKFLSHPKVRGSPVIHRRSFLEKKGLTKEEIDEAFRRVPDSPSSVQTAGVNQDGQLAPSSNIQQQAQAQALQPGVSANTGVATLGTLSRFSFRWSHALIAVGFLFASGAGTVLLIKNSILPRLKSWIRIVVLEDNQSMRKDLKPTSAEEAAQAAKAAAVAAVDMAKVSQEILASKSEDRRYFVEVVSQLDKQVQEMKLMTNAIRRLEASDGVSVSKREDHQITQTSSKPPIVNGRKDNELHSVTSSSQPATAPHSKSYMEIMSMIQRGEKPSNIRDIDDSPPNPNQQPSKPRLAPRTKPWEVGQVQVNGKNLNSSVQDNVPWWQPKNARISEIENETGNEEASNGAPSIQQPVQHVPVLPPPSPILMP